jgi:O-Antigen ligase
MVLGCWAVSSVAFLEWLACGAELLGLVALALGWPIGALAIAGGLAVLAWRNRWWFVVLAAAMLPTTVVGWSSSLGTIEGHALDARLLLTFSVAAIGVAATAWSWRQNPWPWERSHAIEWIGLAFVAYLVLDGLLRSGSPLIWAPPAARWAAYLSIFALAHRYAPRQEGFRVLALAVMVGYAVPCWVAIGQFISGGADFRNAALRATGLGNAGPIAVAFSGQMALLVAYFLILNRRNGTHRAISFAGCVVGTLAIVTAASRLTLATAYVGTLVPMALLRRWRSVLGISVILIAILVARPDIAGRFADAIAQSLGMHATSTAEPSPSTVVSSEMPSPTFAPTPTAAPADSSIQFRVFVWSQILRGWIHEPILGIGPGMTAETVHKVSSATRAAPHNDYVGALAEFGIVGFVLFVGLQVAVLMLLWFRAPGGAGLAERIRSPAFAALTVFTCFNVLGALNNPTYFLDVQVAVWALVGSGLAATS